MSSSEVDKYGPLERIEFPFVGDAKNIVMRGISAPTRGLGRIMPVVYQYEKLSVIKFMILFTCSHWFTVSGRVLHYEELRELLDYVQGRRVHPTTADRLLDMVLRDETIVEKLKDVTRLEKRFWARVAAHIYKSFLNHSVDAFHRHRNLTGFRGKLIEPDDEKKAMLTFKKRYSDGVEKTRRLRFDELYLLYAIANSLKVSDGYHWPLIEDCWSISKGKMDLVGEMLGVTVFKRLRKSDDKLTELAAHGMMDPTHKTFFEKSVWRWHKEYSDAGFMKDKAFDYPLSSANSPSDSTSVQPAPLTSLSLAESTMTASAVDENLLLPTYINYETFDPTSTGTADMKSPHPDTPDDDPEVSANVKGKQKA